jgi:polyisoprenoid-binding protein YceI
MNLRLLLGKGRPLPLLFSLQFLIIGASAQGHYTSSSVNLLVSGTSTLHDWTMKDLKADCSATLDLNANGQLDALSALSFATPVNALKSEHNSMDKNAYKALKSDKAPQISYVMYSVTITQSPAGSTVACKGKLTIAGTARDEDLVAICKTNTDNTITVTGTKKISMEQYNIKPPTFMLGTVKTGNDIVLTFNLILKKS